MTCVNHRAHIKSLAEEFGIEQCNEIYTPVNESKLLKKLEEDEDFVLEWPYRELASALMYVSICTRPDINHTVEEKAEYSER